MGRISSGISAADLNVQHNLLNASNELRQVESADPNRQMESIQSTTISDREILAVLPAPVDMYIVDRSPVCRAPTFSLITTHRQTGSGHLDFIIDSVRNRRPG